MSRLWHFYSYSQNAFDAYTGGGRMGAVEEIVAAAIWDEGAWNDPDLLHRLAEQVARSGPIYTALTPREMKCLDELIPALFAPEGLAAQWDVVPESPDGLHPSAVRELLHRTDGDTLLPILLGGRRYGDTKPSACAYCFLSHDECKQLVTEAELALASGEPWNSAWIPGVIRDDLIGPLRSALARKRSLFGSLG